MNLELHQIPTVALLLALLAVFGGLWLQWKSHPDREEQLGEAPSARQRHLMWLAGWTLVTLRLAIAGSGWEGAAAVQAIALNCIVLAPLMFVGSMAAQHFVRRPPILFVFAFGAPLVLFSALTALDPRPGETARMVLAACAVTAIYIGAAWGMRRNLLPAWISLTLVAVFGSPCLWLVLRGKYTIALHLVSSGILLMAACLFASAFRRVTVGTVFAVGGLTVWALARLRDFPIRPYLPSNFSHSVDLAEVLTAVGMIVLTLEDEIAANRAAHRRDQRAMLEMERYTGLYPSALPYDPSTQEYDDTCRIIAETSRFGQAAIFLRNAGGTFRLSGQFGLSASEAAALDAIARRTTDGKVQELSGPGRASREIAQVVRVDLTPSMAADDPALPEDLRRPRLIGIRVRDGGWQGALLLAGVRHPRELLRPQDVMPLELLVARIGAARENSALLRRLMQSERLAGLGQLASGVAHELNNPLTAVTGFAELLTETDGDLVRERAGVILSEARRMKKIIESLVRFRRISPAARAPFSVELLLRDVEKLTRHDLESARVQFRIEVAPGVPRAVGDGEQIRQVFLQLIRNSMSSLEGLADGEPRLLRVDLARSSDGVRIAFSDSGPGFPDPARAFDPFFTTRHPGEGMGLGLSVCYSIIHEQGGEISAENLPPHGAQIVIDLPVEEQAAGEPGDAADKSMARAIRAI